MAKTKRKSSMRGGAKKSKKIMKGGMFGKRGSVTFAHEGLKEYAQKEVGMVSNPAFEGKSGVVTAAATSGKVEMESILPDTEYGEEEIFLELDEKYRIVKNPNDFFKLLEVLNSVPKSDTLLENTKQESPIVFYKVGKHGHKMVGIKTNEEPPSILIISNNKYDKRYFFKKAGGNQKYLKAEKSFLTNYLNAYHYDRTTFTDIVTISGEASDITITPDEVAVALQKFILESGSAPGPNAVPGNDAPGAARVAAAGNTVVYDPDAGADPGVPPEMPTYAVPASRTGASGATTDGAPYTLPVTAEPAPTRSASAGYAEPGAGPNASYAVPAAPGETTDDAAAAYAEPYAADADAGGDYNTPYYPPPIGPPKGEYQELDIPAMLRILNKNEDKTPHKFTGTKIVSGISVPNIETFDVVEGGKKFMRKDRVMGGGEFGEVALALFGTGEPKDNKIVKFGLVKTGKEVDEVNKDIAREFLLSEKMRLFSDHTLDPYKSYANYVVFYDAIYWTKYDGVTMSDVSNVFISMGKCQDSLEGMLKKTYDKLYEEIGSENIARLSSNQFHNKIYEELSKPRESLNLDMLIGYLYQTLQGISFMHKAGILHKDIACRNVLLCPTEGDKFIAKITDYGLAVAKGFEKSIPTQPTPLPAVIMDMETLAVKQTQNQQTDMWMMGCMIVEAYRNLFPADPHRRTDIYLLHDIDYTGDGFQTGIDYIGTTIKPELGKNVVSVSGENNSMVFLRQLVSGLKTPSSSVEKFLSKKFKPLDGTFEYSNVAQVLQNLFLGMVHTNQGLEFVKVPVPGPGEQPEKTDLTQVAINNYSGDLTIPGHPVPPPPPFPHRKPGEAPILRAAPRALRQAQPRASTGPLAAQKAMTVEDKIEEILLGYKILKAGEGLEKAELFPVIREHLPGIIVLTFKRKGDNKIMSYMFVLGQGKLVLQIEGEYKEINTIGDINEFLSQNGAEGHKELTVKTVGGGRKRIQSRRQSRRQFRKQGRIQSRRQRRQSRRKSQTRKQGKKQRRIRTRRNRK